MFDALTAVTRKPHWYVEGQVPDTIDGRFRMLATVCALAAVRLESAGPEGEAASVALTERFIAVMESEHRQIGFGDPALGRKVRKLVGSLARRVDLWRAAVAGDGDWGEAVRQSLYPEQAEEAALEHSAVALRELWSGLDALDVATIAKGQIG